MNCRKCTAYSMGSLGLLQQTQWSALQYAVRFFQQYSTSSFSGLWQVNRLIIEHVVAHVRPSFWSVLCFRLLQYSAALTHFCQFCTVFLSCLVFFSYVLCRFRDLSDESALLSSLYLSQGEAILFEVKGDAAEDSIMGVSGDKPPTKERHTLELLHCLRKYISLCVCLLLFSAEFPPVSPFKQSLANIICDRV